MKTSLLRSAATVIVVSFLISTGFAQANLLPASGNVGVGTTTPQASVDIWKSYSAGTDSLRFSFNDGSAYWMGVQPYVVGSGNVGYLFRANNGSTTVNALAITGTGNVGIGTTSPAFKLDVVGDVRTTGRLVEKSVTFTPTTVGWYRVVSGSWQVGGAIRTAGLYNNTSTGVEFDFNVRGYGQGSSITLLKNTGTNGNLLSAARTSSDGGGNVYLDLYVSTVTSAAPITIYGFGPQMTGFVASPVVGATAGSTDVRVLPIGWGTTGYDGFRTTGNLEVYSSDGTTTQGYIYRGASGRAAFGNGVLNGETWITRTGSAGSIKIGESDFSATYLTVTGAGNVGIGTTNPINKLEVNGTIRAKEVIVETTGWSDFVFAADYRLAPLSEVEAAIKASGHLPGIPSAAEVAEHGVSLGDMQAKLLAKMEEMTLHQIAQEKRLDAQAARIAQLEAENAALRNP